MAFFKKRIKTATIDSARLPRHIAVIMDGNGRWAKRRGLPRTAGHAAGAENFRTIATCCKELGIAYFTVFAFSTENWKRPPEEVSAIMGLLEQYLEEAIEKMLAENLKLKILGNTETLSPRLRELVARTDALTLRTDGMQVNVCLNYGGRDEIICAARKYAQACAAGTAKPEELTESSFSDLLYTAGIPDPDLIIRPSGEIRTSNFLLWQSAYSEYYFADALWPEFDRNELYRAIEAYQSRSRRFGGTGGAR